MLVIGCIVGVGIFRTASPIAAQVPFPSAILALWVLGGVVSLCGALCYAELAAMFPSTGGDYVYISRVYGRFWGFLFGWTKLFIERTGTVAVLAMVFSEYVRRVIRYDEPSLRWVAAAAVVLLTAINAAGLRWGKYVQNLFTTLKIGALISLVAAGASAALSPGAIAVDWTLPPLDLHMAQSLGIAFIFVLWTYGGWTEAAYVAEEVRQPVRNVPRAIVGGLLVAIVLYALVNWSYLACIPMRALPATPLVASDAMQRVLGSIGAAFIAWMVACSAFGALNGYILTGGRILYAIGSDHALFARLGALHPTRRTPVRALWANAAIAIALIFTKTFDQIMTYSTVAISIFLAMAVFGVVRLRRSLPDHPRPYRAWGYPLTPLLFCVTIGAFILDVLVKKPSDAAFGFILLALGMPLYWLSQRNRPDPIGPPAAREQPAEVAQAR